METFFWQSSIHELPAEGQSIIVQYKTFEFEQVKYTKAKQEWFERNVQCWLKKVVLKTDAKGWKIVPTAVYYTIKDANDNLICFMSLSEHDYENAKMIIELVAENNRLKKELNAINDIQSAPSAQ